MKPPVYDPDWSDEVKAVYCHDMAEIWDRSINPQAFNCYHNQLELYKSIAGQPRKRILDVGCAQATLAIRLAEHGHKVTAVDMRQEFLDYAQTRKTSGDIDFICGNALQLDLSEKFDIIFANQIVEHIVYPGELVLGLKALLEPRGKLVVTTPNHAYCRNFLPSFTELGDPKQWEHLQFTADGNDHFYAYTELELRRVFEDCGFDHIESHFFDSPWMTGHMKLAVLHRFVPRGFLRWLDRLVLGTPIAPKLSHQLMIVGIEDIEQ